MSVDYDLLAAVLHNRAGDVEQFLARGADPNTPGAIGTALHHAIFKCRSKLVRMLVEGGADIEARSRRGLTALHLAITAKPEHPTENPRAISLEMVQYLVSVGADVQARTKANQYTPLELAKLDGNALVLDYLQTLRLAFPERFL